MPTKSQQKKLQVRRQDETPDMVKMETVINKKTDETMFSVKYVLLWSNFPLESDMLHST